MTKYHLSFRPISLEEKWKSTGGDTVSYKFFAWHVRGLEGGGNKRYGMGWDFSLFFLFFGSFLGFGIIYNFLLSYFLTYLLSGEKKTI